VIQKKKKKRFFVKAGRGGLKGKYHWARENHNKEGKWENSEKTWGKSPPNNRAATQTQGTLNFSPKRKKKKFPKKRGGPSDTW